MTCHLSSQRSDWNAGQLIGEAARRDGLPHMDAFLGTSNRGLLGNYAFKRLLIVCPHFSILLGPRPCLLWGAETFGEKQEGAKAADQHKRIKILTPDRNEVVI